MMFLLIPSQCILLGIQGRLFSYIYTQLAVGRQFDSAKGHQRLLSSGRIRDFHSLSWGSIPHERKSLVQKSVLML